MDPELQTIIKQYNAVPEGIQQTVFYGEIEKVISEIGGAYGLSEPTITLLENDVTLVLLLLQSPAALKQKLTDTYNLSEDDAAGVLVLIESLLLVPTFARVAASQPTSESVDDSPLASGRATADDQAANSDEQNYVSLDQDSLMKRDQS